MGSVKSSAKTFNLPVANRDFDAVPRSEEIAAWSFLYRLFSVFRERLFSRMRSAFTGSCFSNFRKIANNLPRLRFLLVMR